VQLALAFIEPSYCSANTPILKKQSLEHVAKLR
jgi:hypothetical protein